MKFREFGKHRVEHDGQHEADRRLQQVVGDGRSRCKSLPKNQCLLAEIAGNHNHLRRQFDKRQLPER